MQTLVYASSSGTRRALTDVLSRRGHQVTALEDADSVPTACQSQRYPLAVLDVDSPNGSGAELCRRLRQSAPGNQCEILALTRRADPTHLKELLAAGFDDYILVWQVRKLFSRCLHIAGASDDQYLLRRDQGKQAVVSDAQQALIPKQRNELFRMRPAALRPEPGSTPSCQNDCI